MKGKYIKDFANDYILYLAKRYKDGDTLKSLSKELGISVAMARKILLKSNVKIRSCSENMRLRYKKNPELKFKITKKAIKRSNELAKIGKHGFQCKKNRDALRVVSRTEKYRLKQTFAHLGEKNGMYGKKSWNYGMKIIGGSWNYKDDRKTIKCTGCGKEMIRRESYITKTNFCSKKCMYNYRKNDKHPAWKTEKKEREFWNGTLFPDEVRKKVYERFNYTCQLCGKKNNFNIHHIDYDKNNNELENYVLLCTSCHVKTNYRREHWQYFFENHRIDQECNIPIVLNEYVKMQEQYRGLNI